MHDKKSYGSSLKGIEKEIASSSKKGKNSMIENLKKSRENLRNSIQTYARKRRIK